MNPPAPRPFLTQLFERALAAVDPGELLARHLPPPPRGRTVVIGAGKAAARMAEAVERHWQGELSGLVVTRYGHGAPTARIEVIEAGHPVPDEAGVRAATRMLELVQGLGEDDLVLCLMSGGGSALLSLPAPGITAEEKREINRALLRSGAPIGEMNCVRRHLSRVKGGRLALACHPARVLTLVVSDVPGDDPAVVASGPTVPDGSSGADALAIPAGAQGLGGIFDDAQVVLVGQCVKHRHVQGQAGQVHRDDCLGTWRDRGFYLGQVEVAGNRVDVGKYRRGAHFQNYVGGGDP